MTATQSTDKTTGTGSSSKKSASRSTGEDAIALLTQDHREMKELFKAYKKLAEEEAPALERQSLAEEICEALTLHATLEEEIFYPAVRDTAEDADDVLDEAEVEHASVKELVAQIKAMDPDDYLYNATVKVLGEYVDHHVKEEEGQIFPKARACDMELEQLGKEIKERKEELQGLDMDADS